MTDLSQAIARNIASRRREPVLAERVFLGLNLAAEGVGVLRLALTRAAIRAADAIGILRKSAIAAWPGIRVRLLRAVARLAVSLRKRVAISIASRRTRVADAAKATETAIPLRVRRRWAAALRRLGRSEVRYLLDQTAHLPADAPFTGADTGIVNGATRYPVRHFVINWAADTPEDDGGVMRILTICAIGFMIGAGVLSWTFG